VNVVFFVLGDSLAP